MCICGGNLGIDAESLSSQSREDEGLRGESDTERM